MRFRNRFMALAAVPFLANSAMAVTVGFQGDYAPSNFTLTTNGGSGSVNTAGAPATIALTGNNDGGSNVNTDYTAVAAGASPVSFSFDWTYSSGDVDFWDQAFYLAGGTQVFLAQNSSQGSGSAGAVVDAGDVLGFRVLSVDGGFGPGTLTISNFTVDDPSSNPAGQWNSETYKRVGNASISNLAQADDAINNGVLQGSGLVNSVNYLNNIGGNDGNFGGGINPLGIPDSSEDFAVKSTGFLQIGEDGKYQFRNNTDDGSRLRIDLNGDGVFGSGEDVIVDNVLQGPHNADSAILNLLAGQYMIEHVWYERGGGAEGELGISRDAGPFFLLGNPQSDGFGAYFAYDAYVTAAKIIPEPATASLGLMALAGLMMRRRRMA